MDDQNNTPSFFDSLPDEIKTDEAFAGYKELQPADLVKQHAELSGRVKEAIVPPGENAADEEKTAFSAKLRQLQGVPESPDGYQPTLPEGVAVDDPLLQTFIQEGHKAGMAPAHVQAGVDAFVKFVQQQEQQAQTIINQQIDALKIEQGAKFEEFKQTSEAAMRELGIEAGYKAEEVQAMLEATGLKNNVMFIKMFNKASRFFEEGKLKGEGVGQGKTLADKFFPGGIK